MEVLDCISEGRQYLVIASDMWDGERKVLDNLSTSSSARSLIKAMKLDPDYSNYYKYSIFRVSW